MIITVVLAIVIIGSGLMVAYSAEKFLKGSDNDFQKINAEKSQISLSIDSEETVLYPWGQYDENSVISYEELIDEVENTYDLVYFDEVFDHINYLICDAVNSFDLWVPDKVSNFILKSEYDEKTNFFYLKDFAYYNKDGDEMVLNVAINIKDSILHYFRVEQKSESSQIETDKNISKADYISEYNQYVQEIASVSEKFISIYYNRNNLTDGSKEVDETTQYINTDLYSYEDILNILNSSDSKTNPIYDFWMTQLNFFGNNYLAALPLMMYNTDDDNIVLSGKYLYQSSLYDNVSIAHYNEMKIHLGFGQYDFPYSLRLVTIYNCQTGIVEGFSLQL